MPDPVSAALALIGAEVGGTIGASLIMYSTQIAYSLVAVSAFSYSAHQKRRMERKATAAYNASLRDRTLTVRGTLEERDLVMGRVRKGGFFYPIGTTGADKEKFTFIVVMAGHSIHGVNRNYFDEHPLTLDGDGYVTSAPYVSATKLTGSASVTLSGGSGSVTLPHTPIAGSVVAVAEPTESTTVALSVSVAGRVVTVSGGTVSTCSVTYQYLSDQRFARIRWVMGSDSQAAFAGLVTEFPGLWTSAHRLRGCTYAVIELTYSQEIFPQGVPNFSADLFGADTVYDPRTATTGYSDNLALLARWYALHPMGGRRTTAQLDEASFIAAANVCDTSVDYGDGSVPLYIGGYVAKAGQRPADALDELCEAMAGMWGYTQGKVRVRAGAVATPVATITADWLLTRQMSTRARRPRAELRNVLQGTFADRDNSGQVLQFTRVVDSAAVTEDGGELVGDLELMAVTRNGQAQQVAACMLRYERQALVVTLVLKMRAWPLQLFDVVAVTLADMGWSGKLFEVMDRAFALGGGVRVTLKETDASIYTFGSSFPVDDPAPNTLLPNPRSVPTIGTVAVTSSVAVLPDGTVRTIVDVTWPAITDASVTQGGFAEVGVIDTRDPGVVNVVRADRIDGHAFAGMLPPGVHHYLFARAVNGLAVRGDWSLAALHQVARKTAAPANVAGLAATAQPGGVAITVTPSAEADVKAGGALELRTGASWAAGTRIFRGPSDRHVWPWPAAGSYTIRAKWIDSSGNESASDASVGITVDAGNLIGTSQVAADAVTKVHTATASAVAVTGEKGVPTGTFTDLVTLTIIPPVDCEVLIAVDGTVSIATAATGSLGDYAMCSTRLLVNGSLVGPLHSYAIDLQLGFSKTAGASIARAHSFAATGGVAYTVTVQAQQYVVATTCTVDSIRLRLEEIRR